TNNKFTQALVDKANKEDTVLQTLLKKLKYHQRGVNFMIRLGTKADLPAILNIVNEAKAIMRQDGNHQWDEQYPLETHFEEDIKKKSLFVLEANSTIFAFIVVDQQQPEWYDELAWPIDRNSA